MTGILKRKNGTNSRTQTLNAVALVTAAFTGAMDYLPAVEHLITPVVYPWLLAGFGLANYIIRSTQTDL